MSRDWTPREMIEVDRCYFKNKPFLEIAKNTVFTDSKGNESPLLSEEEYHICKKCKYLGSLLLSEFAGLYQSLESKDVLLDYEEILRKYIEEGIGDTEEPVIKWFNGKLDPNFYYNEINNRMLINDIISKCKH